MGQIHISKELEGTEVQKMVFKFLRREHNAKIVKVLEYPTTNMYNIEGDEDIPFGLFTVTIKNIVDKVYSIKVDKY